MTLSNCLRSLTWKNIAIFFVMIFEFIILVEYILHVLSKSPFMQILLVFVSVIALLGIVCWFKAIGNKISIKLCYFSIIFVFLLVIYSNIAFLPACSPDLLIKTPDHICNIESEISRTITVNYSNEVYPRGKMLVEAEIMTIRSLPTVEEKIDAILEWEYYQNKTWIHPEWAHVSYNCYNNIAYDKCSFKTCYNDITRIRAEPGNENYVSNQKNLEGIYYYNDPYWIAYYKVGACSELAALFSYVANNSGIESQLVETTNIFYGHRWVEVNISGKWMYVDPWCAGQYNQTHDFSRADKWRWYNETKYFGHNCYPFKVLTYYPNLKEKTLNVDYSPMLRYQKTILFW